MKAFLPFVAKPPATAEPPCRPLNFLQGNLWSLDCILLQPSHPLLLSPQVGLSISYNKYIMTVLHFIAAKPPAAVEPPSKVFLFTQINMWRYGSSLQPSHPLPESRVSSSLTSFSSRSKEIAH